MTLTFLLNGEEIRVDGSAPTTTLLDYLREARGLTGTKEGCNEGDCGACTVMIQDQRGARSLNACILFLPQLQGKSITTVEGLAAPDGTLHPVQDAMITHHGSQCGFCTPGFIMSMATAHTNGATDHADQLAGNLCRCTGYAPILRAAKACEATPPPPHLSPAPFIFSEILRGEVADRGAEPPSSKHVAEPPSARQTAHPTSSDDLAAAYLATPSATLIAGATDVGLWVTKGLQDLDPVIFLEGCSDLKQITESDTAFEVGAMVDMNRLRDTLAPHYPSFAEMLRRFASQQVRNAATLGGNIANGSPIGDSPPPLIALGATLCLRRGDTRRQIPLEDFFVEYGKQDRAPGEFVEKILIPKPSTGVNLRVYKLSKRFDQDISAVLSAFDIRVADGTITAARIAFGGMAGTPKRASHVEQALIGQPWTTATIAKAKAAFAKDYTPLDDMRASADYRLATAQNMLERAFADLSGTPQSVLEVRP
ncbi:xanthine dehydrogenase small subunit [Epibacterium ulvae]|uniref:xanthine dehydrogenase small subunit n=1 Tax=Epibacterium ulvae TaxID=1156985 RepID=UPI001BFC3C8F|nr:xanthine dehydrogenase small subunit [Epibacterium ulvae]MBT8155688.1 xanthine dehydrogenase small subunit [Epibacterium ulvae]